MRLVMLCLLFASAILATIGAPVNGDPAPGRSPGPPNSVVPLGNVRHGDTPDTTTMLQIKTNQKTNEATIDDVLLANNSDELLLIAKKLPLSLLQDVTSGRNEVLTAPLPSSSEIASVSNINYDTVKSNNVIEEKIPKNSIEPTKISPTANLDVVTVLASEVQPLKTKSFDSIAERGGVGGTSTIETSRQDGADTSTSTSANIETITTFEQKPKPVLTNNLVSGSNNKNDNDAANTQTDILCQQKQKNRIHDYLKPGETVVRVVASSGGNNIVKETSSSVLAHLRFDVTHDVFDTQYSLVHGLLYTVSIELTEHQQTTTIRDFYVETLIDGVAQGEFIDITLSSQYNFDMSGTKSDLSNQNRQQHQNLQQQHQQHQQEEPSIVWPIIDSKSDNIDSDVEWVSSVSKTEVPIFAWDHQDLKSLSNSDSVSNQNNYYNNRDDLSVNGDKWSNVDEGISNEWRQINDNFNQNINNYNKKNIDNDDDEEEEENDNVNNDTIDKNYNNDFRDNDGTNESQENAENIECSKFINKNIWWNRNFLLKNEKIVNNWIINDNYRRINERNNQTVYFRILYRTMTSQTVFELIYPFLLLKDCHLYLKQTSGELDYTNLPIPQYKQNRNQQIKKQETFNDDLFRKYKKVNIDDFLMENQPDDDAINDCVVYFKSHDTSSLSSAETSTESDEFNSNRNQLPGLLIQLTRLNIPCNNGGYIKFNKNSDNNYNNKNFNINNNNNNNITKTQRLCGKLEELQINERKLYFIKNYNINILLHKLPKFNLNYKLVDYCYNITLNNYNNSYILNNIKNNLNCYFKIHLPYGYKIKLNLYIKNGDNNNKQLISNNNNNNNNNSYNDKIDLLTIKQTENDIIKQIKNCNINNGLLIELYDYINNNYKWIYCLNNDNYDLNNNNNNNNKFIKFLTYISSDNILVIRISKKENNNNNINYNNNNNNKKFSPTLLIDYQAKPIVNIVSQCAFGWIAMRQFCIATFNYQLTWQMAERECIQKYNGHLISIHSELDQNIIDQLLINSPGYKDSSAYWIGASDRNFESDFRWSDGHPFTYSNWFPGWPQHGQYNRQPNDDGLSGQDCVELRRHFRIPPGVQSSTTTTATINPLSTTFMWNDRNCEAKNYFICKRPLTDEPSDERSWTQDCNKTISLTREHPRASIWSPGFPRQYPDNANCLTIVTAPPGYRIVLDFEELVLENEPSYDYLEIIEPPVTTKFNQPAASTTNFLQQTKYRQFLHRRTRDSLAFDKNLLNFFKYNNKNRKRVKRINEKNDQSDFFIDQIRTTKIPANNYKSITTPDTVDKFAKPIGIKNLNNRENFHLHKKYKQQIKPRRLCGDWSSKLKLLRHVTITPALALHFVSDYSHHYGGYKAKVSMENGTPWPRVAPECSDERLKPYNGSCYLFVSYPEVDWWTAQQVCRGIGAQLASIATPDEQRFITTNIRNHIDYSPRALYWLGGELAENGDFEWTDGIKMSFQGWLPGQGTIDQMPKQPTCLGLHWKMSPTPMLPSGLYWSSQKCSQAGGYICKRRRPSSNESSIQNQTISSAEGRLTSPGYPSPYPSNVDYWVRIIGPDRTRLIIQFQKLDLESQEECLYDYVSIQNFDLDVINTPLHNNGINHDINIDNNNNNNKNNNEEHHNEGGGGFGSILMEPGTNPIPMAMFVEDVNDIIESRHRRNEMTYQPKRVTNLKKDFFVSRVENLRNIKYIENGEIEMSIKKLEKSLKQKDKRSINYEQVKDGQPSLKEKIDKNVYKKLNGILEAEHFLKENIKLLEKTNRLVSALNLRRTKRYVNDNGDIYLPVAPEYLDPDGYKGSVDNQEGDARRKNQPSFLPYVRWCGSHEANMSRFDFVAASNQALLRFHSDFSVTGSGFSATWSAVDVSGCPIQTLTSREGAFSSPNFPHFLLNNLDCSFVIQAPLGKRVWLEINEHEILEDGMIDMDVGNGDFRPFNIMTQLNDGVFVSQNERLKIRIRTGQRPRGRGFRATYKTMNPIVEHRTVTLSNNTNGILLHLNYPQSVPTDVDFTQHLVAPVGDVILLELHGVGFSDNDCHGRSSIEILDNYADANGTKWSLCELLTQPTTTEVINFDNEFQNKRINDFDDLAQSTTALVYITSYLNTLHIRQRTINSNSNVKLNATVRIQTDVNYKTKLVSADDWVETCQPNPCQFGGKCVLNGEKRRCQCRGHYTGRFCGLNMCELDPCLFGQCELTATSFRCHCQSGYVGHICDQKQNPCAENPCESRGECFEKTGGFHCRCHAWWEGKRCEKRMIHIPYKPLAERMLQEPFWLGLITVSVVLAIIGLVWCAKRHFPEKIEKLLAEEADRNRPPGSLSTHHHPSLREQLQFTSAIPQSTANTPGAPRSIFGRLGIRKPSILSLSSPQPAGGATARTFSLDDLLRPPPRRTPSPRKKRNNSTPTKKNAAEKKQILQQLISPAVAQTRPKVSLGELIQLSENRLKAQTSIVIDSESDLKETTFSENSGSAASTSTARQINDPKLEKKVTFARLLSKVSAEMSSGSEVDVGNVVRRSRSSQLVAADNIFLFHLLQPYPLKQGPNHSSALSLPVEIPTRANSVPPSPCTNDIRSPHSTSSNQGSDSLSSSEIALSELTLKNTRRIRPKVSSADSILAMFKNFASATAAVNLSATGLSPSTTPTASSPQDDVPGDDDSSTSSMHTPVSFSSGAPDSPIFYRQSTIEVPVLDPLSAHKTSPTTSLLHPPTILLEIPNNGGSGINKCLSPIHEMPTPMPSPALTPIMPRARSPSLHDDPLSFSDDDDKDRSLKNSDIQRVVVDLHAEMNRLDSEIDTTLTDTTSTADTTRSFTCGRKARLQQRSPAISISIDINPPTPEERLHPPRELIIPTLMIEQPSPTKDRVPVIMFPGSPPPQRASIGETSFMFPNKQQQKRLLKQFEKPTSLDLPFAPPMITITSNMSEVESDAEGISPAPGKIAASGLLGVPGVGAVGPMCYLSPFSICTRGDRTTSESNLSSSGYSSMASPGPSRCGSNNPLCPSEMEDPGTGPSGSNLGLHAALVMRRQSPLLKTMKESTTSTSAAANGGTTEHEHIRRRSDSETLSDDPLLESNDEGIGTDHLDEKIDEGEIKSAKDLELYIGKELLENGRSLLGVEETITMSQLQLPSIVIQTETGDKGLSPVSSRSESPLSERTTSLGRFSPLFYGRKDQQLPFTDSDGLYDFPSSDGKGNGVVHHRKTTGKRRERKSSRTGLTQSPSKTSIHLELPNKDSAQPQQQHHHHQLHHQGKHHTALNNTTRKSPKRRPLVRHPVASSSSSSESITSAREMAHRSTKIHLGTNRCDFVAFTKDGKLRIGSGEDTGEDVSSQILPKMLNDDITTKPNRKLSRLRAIGNQIRFLRRLEQSIKRRDLPSSSRSDSCVEEHDDVNDGNVLNSLKITAPLLDQQQQQQQQQPQLPASPHLAKTRLIKTRQKRISNVVHPNDRTTWRGNSSERPTRGYIHGELTSD